MLLNDRNADTYVTDILGRNCLHLACAAGKAENVDLLMKYMDEHPQMNANDFGIRISNSGNNALMFAIESGNVESVVACLNAGVNPFQVNSLGEDAARLALKYPAVVNSSGETMTTFIDNAVN